MKWVNWTAIFLLGVLFGEIGGVRNGFAGYREHVIDSHFVGPFDLFVTDLDNDGDLDLLVAGQDNRQVAWYENNGSGNFYKHIISDRFSGAWCVWGGDVNKDGRMDVLGASGALNEITWWENHSGSFSEHVIDTNLISAESVCTADFTNDGRIDIAAVGTYDSTNAIVWYENRGDNTFRKKSIDPTLKWAHDIFPVDIDRDGRMDVVVAAATEQSFVWYRNRGNGNFEKNVFGRNYYGAYSIYAADVNGDGYPDVQGVAHSKNEVVWWENDGGIHLITHVIDSNLGDAISVYASDANNDGYVDILATGKSSNTVALYKNDGSEHFTKIIISNTFGGARSPVVGDFNGDGKTDIAAVALNDNKISWWENTSSTVSATLTVDSPNGGENWFWGTTYTIRWHSTGTISSVDIEYSTDGGNSWKSIAHGQSNSGFYSWIIPNDVSSSCLVRVINSSNSSIYDRSDHAFSISDLRLSGHVYYCDLNVPIPHVTLSMTGTLDRSEQSNSDGYYLFENLKSNGNYRIEPQKQVKEDVGDEAIDAYDAALAARYSVGLKDMDSYAKMAADVDNDGEVLMYDAANIARYSVGLSIPSNILVGHWFFLPSDTTIDIRESNATNIDFRGILKGDVSKDWRYSSALAKDNLGSGNYFFISSHGDTLAVNLRVPGIDILAVDLILDYDPQESEFLGVEQPKDSEHLQVFYHNEFNQIRLAGYSAQYIHSDGNILKILFKKKDMSCESGFSIHDFKINGTPLSVTNVVSRTDPHFPSEFQLSASYPNPFNGICHFSVALPERGLLEIRIYNMLGMLVKKLVQKHFTPGQYTFSWNGRDRNGNFVSSGEYVIVARFRKNIRKNKILFVK